MRERRVKPCVSSRSAARVRATSTKPNAVRRASTASAVSGPAPASVSSSGAKNSRSWIDRTRFW